MLGSVRPQAAIVGADGKDDEPCANLLTVGEHQLPQPIALGPSEATAFVSAGDDGAELPRLQRRPLGQVRPGETRRKAEVVLDPGAGTRLPSRSETLDDQRREPLGGGVDGGGQPAGPAPSTTASNVL